jgi:hypothetical protein
MPLPFDTSSLKLRVGAMGFSCGSGASGTASIFSMVRGFGGVRSSNSCGETSTRLVPGKGPLTDWTAAVLSLAWAMRRFSLDSAA